MIQYCTDDSIPSSNLRESTPLSADAGDCRSAIEKYLVKPVVPLPG